MKRLVRDLIHQKEIRTFSSVEPRTSLFEALNSVMISKVYGTSLLDAEPVQKLQNKVPIYYTNSSQEVI